MKPLYSVLVSAAVLLCLAGLGSSFQCEKENFFGITQYFSCPQPGDDSDDVFCCGDDHKYCCSLNPHKIFEDAWDRVFDDDDVEGAIKNLDSDSTATPPLALALSSRQQVMAKLNDTATATKDKMKAVIGGKITGVKDKVKAKVNGTVSNVKNKVKQKVKDKVKEKASQKLDPSGGIVPIVVGVIITIIVLIVCLICCCCCCPFCFLYKRKQRNANPEVSVMQPLQAQQQPYAPPPQQGAYPTQAPPAGYPPQPYPPQPYPPQPYPPQPYPADQPPQYTEKQPPPYNPTY